MTLRRFVNRQLVNRQLVNRQLVNMNNMLLIRQPVNWSTVDSSLGQLVNQYMNMSFRQLLFPELKLFGEK